MCLYPSSPNSTATNVVSSHIGYVRVQIKRKDISHPGVGSQGRQPPKFQNRRWDDREEESAEGGRLDMCGEIMRPFFLSPFFLFRICSICSIFLLTALARIPWGRY